MILIRNVFQAKYGQGNELVALLKETASRMEEQGITGMRIMTDASGRFFTVVTEAEAPSFAAYEEAQAKTFASPEFGEFFARMMPLVEYGSREFYHIQS